MPELMEVLEHLDSTGQVMVKRLPEAGQYEIKWGAQLTVRENQVAIFFRDGKALDIFGPGRHVLETQNIPLITKLVTSLGYGTTSPFRAEVYFLNMKLFPNLKWGTREPILFKDTELQMIRIRSFGMFSIKINDPTLFLNTLVGTKDIYSDVEIEDYLKQIIITRLTNVLGNELESIFDLPSDFNTLSILLRTVVQKDLNTLGVELHELLINSISVPPEVQSMIDSRSGMSAIGDMDKFLKFKAAMAMEKAASNPDGSASAGVGVGAGMGMGFMMPQMLANAMQPNSVTEKTSEKNKGDPIEKLKKLKELLDMGIINQDEYDEKKDKLLSEI